jgi:hypothetical protein
MEGCTMADTKSTTLTSRRTVLAGIACLPVALAAGPTLTHGRLRDPLAPKCIRWPFWAGHDRAGCVMTPAELAKRYSDPKKLRYALRRLARYQAETERA